MRERWKEMNQVSVKKRKTKIEKITGGKCHSKSLYGLTGSQSSPSHFTFQRLWGCGMAVTNPRGKGLFCMEIALPGTISFQRFYKPSCWWVMDSHSELLSFRSAPCRYFAWKRNKAWSLGFRLCQRLGLLSHQEKMYQGQQILIEQLPSPNTILLSLGLICSSKQFWEVVITSVTFLAGRLAFEEFIFNLFTDLYLLEVTTA